MARVSLNRTPALCASKALGGYPVGPRSVDERAARDVLALPGANVLQLGGNVSEWVTATNAPTCVEEGSMSTDPRCGRSLTLWGSMGGSWVGPRPAVSLSDLASPVEESTAPNVSTGFRCVYDARP